jgi:hypothetical protein
MLAELEDSRAEDGGPVALTCSVSGKGTVAPAGEGSITELRLSKCSKIKRGGCKTETKEAEESKEWVTAYGLPWKTQLMLNGKGAVRLKTTLKIGYSVGFQWECKEALLGGTVKDVCTDPYVESEPENAATGVFDWYENNRLSPWLDCTRGDEGSGTLYGKLTIKGPEGKILSVKE